MGRPDLTTPAPAPAWLFVCVAAILLAIAAWAMPVTVQAGDAGEMSTVMLRGGIPHPSGYPWIRVLGVPARAFEALGGAPATAAALPCALATVGGLLLCLGAIARWLGPGPAAWSVLVAGSSIPLVLHGSDAEVWGPLVFFAGLVLRVAAAERPSVRVLGLTIGLGVSHHLTAVLLVPIVVAAAWPRAADFPDRRAFLVALARRGATGIGFAALGLLPLLTLAAGDGGAWRWGDPTTPAGLWHHVSRADYGSLQLSLHTASVPVVDQWRRAVASVGNALGCGLPSGAATGAVTIVLVTLAAIRARAPERPALRIGLGVAFFASLFALPAAFDLDPASPFAAWILRRFDVLTIVLGTPALAAVASIAITRVPTRRARILLALAGVMLVVHALAHTRSHGVPSTQRFVQRYAVDLLRTPPPGRAAIVLGTDDHRTFPVLFAQAVLGEGSQVIYVDASLLAHAWYRAQLREQAPWLPDVDKPLRMIAAMWNDPQHADTPVYLANVFSRPAAALPRVPEGILWRVVAPHEPPPGPDAVLARHLDALARYGAPPPVPATAVDPWTLDLMAAYHDGHGQLVSALRTAGREGDAEALDARIDPTLSPP